MPLFKQKGGVRGAQRNLNILCNVFLSSTLLIGILLTATGCCAKIETQIKLLNDDYSVPTRTRNDDASSSLSSDTQQPTMPHSNLYKNDLKRISYETIHRILRDENEPMIYRTNDLRYFRKRSSSTTEHGISKRSLGQVVLGESPAAASETALNLTDKKLQVFSQGILNTSRPLEEITSIILHNNNLKEFPIRVLPNLALLDLSQNNFTKFDLPAEYYNLRFLNLNRNRIENFTIQTSSNITQKDNTIRELHLKDNAIHWLGQMNLGSLNELEVLDLSCNQLESVEMVLFPTRMKNLKYLNLAHNRLQSIYRETFYNLLSVNTLILSYNEINEINYETFLALPNLQYLDLSHNQLKGDSIRALQGIPDLVGLSIANNRELGNSMQEFVASWSLKELDASGTGLCKIPAVLAQSVRTLKLANNWLTIINCGDLDSYPLLQYLDLSNSHIDEIEEDALGRLEILETLFLDHNNLKKIPISLPTTLEHLFLQDNQIMDVPLQSFQGLNNLKTLDLSTNKLIYLPDLPLPKLLTLNLQSSGITSLHQGIIKTSPHLRDLFLEDNPIKCADLLGITEWASPCRNDRRITKRINIKLYYVQMHNYYERFQCIGVDVMDKCASCFGDVNFPVASKEIDSQPNCVDFNRPIRQKATKPLTTTTTVKSTSILIQERKNINETKEIAIKLPITPKTHIDKSTTTQNSTTRIATQSNQNQLKTQNLEATLPETSTPKTNTSDREKETNSTNIISLSPTKKEKNNLEHEISALFTHNPFQLEVEIKSDNNYVGKSSVLANSGSGSLLSKENIGEIQKGLSAQSDNATKIGRSINKEISVATNVGTAVKSNLPTTITMLYGEQTQPTTMPIPTTMTTTTTTTMTTTTTEAIAIRHTPKGKESNAVTLELQQLQIQHPKDRHLIGTPLLMHKGHVVVLIPQSQSASQTMTNSKEINLSHLALSQDASHTTSDAISKGNKFQLTVGAVYPLSNQQQQELSKENAITKSPPKRTITHNNGQDSQQTPAQQQNDASQFWIKLENKKKHQTNDQNRIVAENTTIRDMLHKFKERENFSSHKTLPKDKKVLHIPQQDQQFSSKLEVTIKSEHHHNSHSLNTPFDVKIQSPGYNQLLEGINDLEENKEASSTESTTSANHHSRINTSLMKNENDLQNKAALRTSHELTDNGIEKSGTTAALIKLEEQPLTTSHLQQENPVISERWLDIRNAKKHPGLVAVIVVTFAMVFVVGLFQVYRYHKKPLNYISHHQKHYVYQHHEHQQSQYHHQNQKEPQFQNHQQRRHHHQHHQLRMDAKSDSKGYCSFENNQNQCSNYGCDEDRTLCQLNSAFKSLPAYNFQQLHEKSPLPLPQPQESGCSNYEFQREQCSMENSAPNRSSHGTTFNYKLFQVNDKPIKHHHPPPDDKNDVYMEMNHVQQSVLTADLFPMELLTAPSRIQSLTSSASMDNSLAGTTSAALYAERGIVMDEQQKEQRRSKDGEYQDSKNYHQKTTTSTGRERSKFEIW